MNKTRMIVTRVFDSGRTPQEAFVRAILNAEMAENGLKIPGCGDIMESGEPPCNSPASPEEGEANG